MKAMLIFWNLFGGVHGVDVEVVHFDTVPQCMAAAKGINSVQGSQAWGKDDLFNAICIKYPAN